MVLLEQRSDRADERIHRHDADYDTTESPSSPVESITELIMMFQMNIDGNVCQYDVGQCDLYLYKGGTCGART